MEVLSKALYPPGHAYRGLSDGYVRRITLDGARWFYQRWYQPDNAVLAIVGAFHSHEARRLIDRYFAPIVARHARRDHADASPVRLARDQRWTISAFTKFDSLFVAWPITPTNAEKPALRLLTACLNRPGGRLRSSLTKADTAYRATAGLTEYDAQSFLLVRVVLRPDGREELALGRIRKALEAMESDLEKECDVERDRERALTRLLTDRERFDERARRLAVGDPLETEIESTRNVTVESMRTAIRRHLVKSGWAILRVNGGEPQTRLRLP
jgi:zinc protease